MTFDACILTMHPVVQKLAEAFAGHQLYLVGGSVRDLFTTGTYDDLDFATEARPDEIERLVSDLGSVWTVGKAFGTIGVSIDGQKVEITTYRADTYDRQSRQPEVSFGDNLIDDLARRDFTVNAMAVNAFSGELVDPFGGATDLHSDILRTPLKSDVTIKDDPLRSLRAIRFAATRGMRVSPELVMAICRNAPSLGIVSQERKTGELMKIAGKGPRPLAIAAELARTMNVYAYLFGGLVIIWDLKVPIPGYSDPLVALAAAAVETDTFTRDVLIEMRFAHQDAKRVADIVHIVHFLRNGFPTFDVRHAIRAYGDDVIVPALGISCHLDGQANEPFRTTLETEGPTIRGPLPVNGDDFLAAGLVGPQIGLALRRVETEFLLNLKLSREMALKVGVGMVVH